MTILTLAEAKLALNKTDTDDDVELQSFIDSIVAPIEKYVGPVDSRSITETTECDGCELPLQQQPVISVTSITSIYTGGPTWVTADLHVNKVAGIVRRLDQGAFYGGPFTTIYVAGRASVPASINMAARLIVKHMWATQRGASKRGAQGGSDVTTLPGWGYSIPNRAAELLDPYAIAAGIA